MSATAQHPVEPLAGSSADVAWRLESTISRLLVAGTYLAMGLIVVGVVLMLAAGIDPLAHGGVPPFELSAIPAEIAAGNPLGFLWLGLVAVLLVVLGSIVAAIRLEG